MSDSPKHTLAARIDEFRAWAEEAKMAAQRATTATLRQDYEELARSWEKLIGEIERG